MLSNKTPFSKDHESPKLVKKHHRDLNKTVFDCFSSSVASITCHLGHEQLIPGPHAASSGSYDIISMTSLHLLEVGHGASVDARRHQRAVVLSGRCHEKVLRSGLVQESSAAAPPVRGRDVPEVEVKVLDDERFGPHCLLMGGQIDAT